ncbi:unnamed protein product, partial [Brenthis ino]
MLFLILILVSVARANDFITVISESYSYVSYPDYRILNDGNIIPTLALGTFTPYKSERDPGVIEQAVITAIEAGYRHIDTAPLYCTEGEIGNAINNVTSRGIVTREELFITTKVNPTYTELELTAYCLREGIAVMSYGPYGFMVPRPFRNITARPPTFDDQTLKIIANKYGKSTKQVVLRYLVALSAKNQPKILLNDGNEMPIIAFGTFGRVGVSAKDQPKIRLNDGNEMPTIAFGTFGRIVDITTEVRQSVIWAVKAGYRHIDTAAVYLNEEEVGKAIKNVTTGGIVKREDLFITTKLDFGLNGSMVLSALNTSLNKLQLDYVDLYLIHIPNNWITLEEYDLVDTWKGMEEVKRMGLAKSIGVSNFNSSHINRLLTHNNIRPAVNQVEVNPTHASLDLVAYCQKEGIVVTSYAPMGFLVPRPFRDYAPPPLIDDPNLTSLSIKYGKTVRQILIRYLLDCGTVPISKSSNKNHIQENIDVFDFSLSKEDIYLLNEFNLNMKVYDFSIEIAEALVWYYYGMKVEDFFPS